MNSNYPFENQIGDFIKSKFRGYITHSRYIQMRDGVKVAMDIHLPKELPKSELIPSVLIQTRYWRSFRFRIPVKWFMKEPFDPRIVKLMTNFGFAVIWVDVRGTGASFGTRSYPFSKSEIKDGSEIIDWIIKQPWSDGNVFAWGNSYSGVTAELSASNNNNALKAVIPKHNPWDLYLHACFPGGCFNNGFISLWSSLGKAQDQTSGKALLQFRSVRPLFAKIASRIVCGVKPVVTNSEDITLKEIADIHSANHYPIEYAENVIFRDDKIKVDGPSLDEISIFSYKENIQKSKIPFYCWGSWQDSATADMVISRFLNFDIPQIAIIGDWEHKAIHKANPYFSSKKSIIPSKSDQIKNWLIFYRNCLEDKIKPEKILFYYTMGEEKWKKTNQWPPKNQSYENLYLEEHNLLSSTKPQNKSGKDEYTINYESTTGIRNRWYTLLSLPVKYPNRKIEDKGLLIYTTKPLENVIEITGHPIITLYMDSTHEDGMICAYLEFIDKKGKIHWITDGQLRLIHRKISLKSPQYDFPTPYHSYKREDYYPLIPDKIAEITFALYPTSILIRKGFKLRLAIAGADKDTFARYPEKGIPTIKIERNSFNASYLKLPIVKTA